MALNKKQLKLSDDEQVEFIKLAGERMQIVKDSIPQIETANEAQSFAIGSAGTLTFLSEKLLSPDVHNDLEDYISSEMKSINSMIDRLRKIE
jgi:hypothetical protein